MFFSKKEGKKGACHHRWGCKQRIIEQICKKCVYAKKCVKKKHKKKETALRSAYGKGGACLRKKMVREN